MPPVRVKTSWPRLLMAGLLLILAAAATDADASSDPCALSVSPGDENAGVSARTDATCEVGGLGCFSSSCRYCKESDSPQSSYLHPCTSITIAPTPVPPTTEPPTTEPPTTEPPTTEPPATSTPTPTDRCADTVSTGDKAVGVSATTDSSCQHGGLGCFTSTCRFCKQYDTPQSSYLNSCTADQPPPTSTTPTAPAAPPPATTTTTPTETPMSTTRVPTPTAAPVVTTPTPTPIPTAPAAFDLECRTTVTSGDEAVGIAVVTDVMCTMGGVGCISDVCRYCQVWRTDQSADFLLCSSIDVDAGDDIFFTPLSVSGDDNGLVVGSTDRPVLDQIVLPDPSSSASQTPSGANPESAVPTNVCTELVSTGDSSVGISAVVDASCQNGGIGCFNLSCRYCKVYDTPQSSYMLKCLFLVSVTTAASSSTSSGTTKEDMCFIGVVGGAVGVLVVVAVALQRQRAHRMEKRAVERDGHVEEDKSSEDPTLENPGATAASDESV